MNQEEKLNKICNDFASLPDEKQDYILGILQALVFANTTAESSEKKRNSANAENQR